MVLYTATTPSTRRASRNRTATSIRCPRAKFARRMVFEQFGYRHARAIDYDKFVDRKPGELPRPATLR
jgi:hypothetical protein